MRSLVGEFGEPHDGAEGGRAEGLGVAGLLEVVVVGLDVLAFACAIVVAGYDELMGADVVVAAVEVADGGVATLVN